MVDTVLYLTGSQRFVHKYLPPFLKVLCAVSTHNTCICSWCSGLKNFLMDVFEQYIIIGSLHGLYSKTKYSENA